MVRHPWLAAVVPPITKNRYRTNDVMFTMEIDEDRAPLPGRELLVHALNRSLVQVLTNIIKFALVHMHASVDVPLIMPSAPSEEKNSRSLQSTPSF